MAKRPQSTYVELQQQIAKLQAQAEAIRKGEVAQVIAQIRAAITHYGLSATDLGYGADGSPPAPAPARKRARKSAAPKARKFTVPVKYRDGNGNTWTGRGNRPRWLVAALAEGKKLEDFAVPAK